MKKFYGLVFAMLMALGISSVASAATVLDFNIDFNQDGAFDTGTTIDLSPGDIITSDIYVSVLEDTGVDAVDGLFGWSLVINYDHLAVTNVTPNYALWPVGFPPTILPGSVTVEQSAPFGSSNTGNDLLLFSLTFECIGPGEDVLSIWDKSLVTTDVITARGVSLDGQFPFELATVNCNAVPIPGAVWLLGSGLLGLVGLRRKTKS